MGEETDKSPSDEENARMNRRLRWVQWLPVPRSVFCWSWLKPLFCSRELSSKLRAAEKERQSEIRRELRGLPPKE